MVVNDSEKSPKVASKFYCDCCDYNTSKKSDFAKHLTTDKHKNNENGSKMVVNGSEKSPKVAQYVCECGKIGSLYHKIRHDNTNKHKIYMIRTELNYYDL